jgi:predicted peroxiredoxin
MIRSAFLAKLFSAPLLFGAMAQKSSDSKLKIMMKSAWGSDDATKAAFPFLHALALAESGHEVQIFLLGEAVSLMRDPVAKAVVHVGWPLVSETLSKLVEKKIQIFACGACCLARGISEMTWPIKMQNLGVRKFLSGLLNGLIK